MLAEPISITYNAVAKSLARINQDSFGSVYYLDDSANQMLFTLSVKHTIPGIGLWPESHLARLDVDYLSVTDGSVIRRASSWGVMKTDKAPQDLVSSQRTQKAFADWFVAAVSNKVLGRES